MCIRDRYKGEGPLYIGYPDGTSSWKGYIDEVRISNIARSEDWIKTCYNTVENADSATDPFITWSSPT